MFEGGPATARRNLRQATSSDEGPSGGQYGVHSQKAPQDSQLHQNTSAGLSQALSGHKRFVLANKPLEAACKWWVRSNVGLAGFCIGTSEDDGHADDLPTLGKQRWKDIVFGKALTTGLWRLLSMVIGCGSKRILCFSRCTLVDRVKSCISFACALKGLPSGRQALT